MSRPAAKRDDRIVGVDTHLVVTPIGAVIPVMLPFDGPIASDLSSTVFVDGAPAATVGSGADAAVPHVAPGGTFQRPPSNHATIASGSDSVRFDDRNAARSGDPATTCNDPVDADRGSVVASGTVIVGD